MPAVPAATRSPAKATSTSTCSLPNWRGTLVAPDGLAGLLVPSGIATDDTTKEFFSELMQAKRLVSLYDFENATRYFEDVMVRFKFSALVFGGATQATEQADFVFFAHGVEDTAAAKKQRHIRAHRGRHGASQSQHEDLPHLPHGATPT